MHIHGVAASYYVNRFELSLEAAGVAAGSFGLLALFARALGGIASDRIARFAGLDGRTWLLFGLMVGEGVGLLLFSSVGTVSLAILCMLTFGLFTHMACGSTYALVPFIDRKALGGVTGIVGAGGNVGAVGAGFLMKWVGSEPDTLFLLGWIVLGCATCAISVRFTMTYSQTEQLHYDEAVTQRRNLTIQGGIAPAN